MHELRSQFRLNDQNVIEYAFHDEMPASEIAAAKSYEVVASNVVQMRKIVGTAFLQNAKENVIKFRIRRC